jgi:thiol-disulfide isomerase/thioredoxin
MAVAAAALMALSAGTAMAQDKPATPPSKDKMPAKAAVTLKVGDAAPAVSIEKWVKGDQITGFEKGKVYVVEFWATWCGPCVASMPHLSELQKEYKSNGLTIIGVTRKDPNNSLEQVEKMVSDKGDGMGYTVAWDKDGETYKSYMKAAGQGGIPTAFVVAKDGKLAYIGHPMFLDTVIEGVTKGTWDNEKGNQEIKDLQKEFFALGKAKNPKDAVSTFNTLEKKYPAFMAGQQDMKFDLLLRAGEFDEAWKVGRVLTTKATAAKNPVTLNKVAWSIVDPEANVKNKDLDLAMDAATKAADFTNNKDAAILDTLARVYFCKGDVAKAISIQEKAVAGAQEEMKDDLQKSLDEYKEAAKKK